MITRATLNKNLKMVQSWFPDASQIEVGVDIHPEYGSWHPNPRSVRKYNVKICKDFRVTEDTCSALRERKIHTMCTNIIRSLDMLPDLKSEDTVSGTITFDLLFDSIVVEIEDDTHGFYDFLIHNKVNMISATLTEQKQIGTMLSSVYISEVKLGIELAKKRGYSYPLIHSLMNKGLYTLDYS